MGMLMHHHRKSVDVKKTNEVVVEKSATTDKPKKATKTKQKK